MKEKKSKNSLWEVPYLLIDPNDIGRNYEAIIRINSQSGKGGVAYVLKNDYGLDLPKEMHPEVGNTINLYADTKSREIKADEIFKQFKENFVNLETPLKLVNISHKLNNSSGFLSLEANINYKGENLTINGVGNGPISAFVNALENASFKNFKLNDYRQHSIGSGSKTEAAAYVQIKDLSEKFYFGCGIDPNIERAGLKALISAFNRLNSQS